MRCRSEATESRSQCKKVSLQNLRQGGYVPPLRRRKGGSPGRLTSQLLLFRAEVPGTSSNKFRHPASAGPLPAQPLAQSPFHLFAPARTYPGRTTHCRLGEKTPFCAFCMSRRQENPGKSTKRLPPRRINRPSRALQLPRRQQNNLMVMPLSMEAHSLKFKLLIRILRL